VVELCTQRIIEMCLLLFLAGNLITTRPRSRSRRRLVRVRIFNNDVGSVVSSYVKIQFRIETLDDVEPEKTLRYNVQLQYSSLHDKLPV